MADHDPDVAYSATTQAHYRHPRNLGRLPHADATGEAAVREPSDNWIQFSLALSGDEVARATFRAIGCAATVAAGSALTEWVMGREIGTARDTLSPAVVLDLLDGLPESKRFCADLAVQGLHRALAEAQRRDTGRHANE